MKKLLVLTMVLVFLGGCGGLTMKAEMAKKFDDNAAYAKAMLTTTQTVEQAKAEIAENATKLKEYYDSSTKNLFTYMFTDKQIYAKTTNYALLMKFAIISQVYNEKAVSGVYTDEQIQLILKEEYNVFIDLKSAKDGEASQ